MTQHPGSRFGFLLAVLGAVGFSFKAILIKLAYPYGVDAITLLALRMGMALPFFVALGWADRRRREPVPLSGRDIALMLGLGFAGYYLSSYLDFLGLQYISAALERLILFAYPTLVVVLSAIFLGKPITLRAIGCIALCYAGIALAVTHDLQAGVGRSVWVGGALVFASAFSYALYLMGNGQAVGRLGAARVTAWASTAACVLCLIHFAATRPLGLLIQPAPVMFLAVAMALFSTVLPVWMISEAIRRLGAGPVSLIGTLGPVITIFLGWMILAEPIGLFQLLGGALVVAGVVLVGKKG
ncbi:MAG TPA: DMT family transporter [Zoogloea sp.]|jgi:drug/metabolite transporter (DMT)-like permease|nr:DMT family transporter [Zoogloea sp.]HOB45978.1 DMT family transporter [Zoogloea sp.]HQE40153.1 DMT family transporter [Zoogloea sp.]